MYVMFEAFKVVDDNEMSLPEFWKNFKVDKCIKHVARAWSEVSASTLNKSWKQILPSFFQGEPTVENVEAEAIRQEIEQVVSRRDTREALQFDHLHERVDDVIDFFSLTNQELEMINKEGATLSEKQRGNEEPMEDSDSESCCGSETAEEVYFGDIAEGEFEERIAESEDVFKKRDESGIEVDEEENVDDEEEIMKWKEVEKDCHWDQNLESRIDESLIDDGSTMDDESIDESSAGGLQNVNNDHDYTDKPNLHGIPLDLINQLSNEQTRDMINYLVAKLTLIKD